MLPYLSVSERCAHVDRGTYKVDRGMHAAKIYDDELD